MQIQIVKVTKHKGVASIGNLHSEDQTTLLVSIEETVDAYPIKDWKEHNGRRLFVKLTGSQYYKEILPENFGQLPDDCNENHEFVVEGEAHRQLSEDIIKKMLSPIFTDISKRMQHQL